MEKGERFDEFLTWRPLVMDVCLGNSGFAYMLNCRKHTSKKMDWVFVEVDP